MQALKDVALRLLNVYVSPYVENLNAHDLSLSVFGGVSTNARSGDGAHADM